jgi:hypothetical protein
MLLLTALLFLPPTLQAEPPHPRLHYKWEVLPQGQVVLYFLENGAYSRYVYPLSKAAKPALECSPKYEKNTFRLVTFDSRMPYVYVMRLKPSMRWDVKQKIYVNLEE